MAISDDLNSIRTHLEDDYTALEQLGVSVEDRNIENIKDMANQIYAKFPKTDYAEGSNITIENCLKGKLDFEDDKVGYGDTVQEGEPTPTTPIPIQVVTGEQEVVVRGKNELEGIELGEINSTTGAETSSTTIVRSVNYIPYDKNVLYYGSVNSIELNANINLRFYNKNKEYIGYASNNLQGTGNFNITIATSVTDTTPKYFKFRASLTISPITSVNDKVQITTVNSYTYEPYITPITKTLNLGDRKVFEDDYLWRDTNGKFYHHHAYQYELFKNGTINRMQTTVSGKYRFSIAFSKLAKAVPNNDVIADIYSNILIKNSGNQIYQAKNGIGINMSGAIHFCYDSFSAYTNEEMTNYFSNKDDYIVYPLAEETDEELTGTLATQLEDIYNMQSVNGTTIVEINGNLPMIMKVRALKNG